MTGASRIWPWLALLLAAVLALQTHRLTSAQLELAGVDASQSKQIAAQAQQAQAATKKKAEAVIEHGSAQQENTHDYTQKLAALEAGRAADTARIASLQHDIRAAATRNAQLASDAAACRGLADQHEQIAALAAEGAGLVSEADGLVAKRDAQVGLLIGQVAADRALINRLMQD